MINLKYPNLKIYEISIGSQIPKSDIEKVINRHVALKNFDIYKTKHFNFRFDEELESFKNLYNEFLKQALVIFGNFTLNSKNKTTCWMQVSSKHDKNVIHNHINTSVINSVFYLKIPDSKTGGLNFYDENEQHLLRHQPTENSLLIFPAYLNHCPETCNSDDYRIAVNMEICCNENVWTTN